MLLLFTSLRASSQLSTVSSDSINYLTAEDEAFMIDKKTNYLIKFNPVLSGIESLIDQKVFTIGIEKKIGKAFSITPTITFNYTNNFEELNSYNVNLELRYFFEMKKRIKQNLQASNLSGKYISILTGLGSSNLFDNFSYGIKAGTQKRFLNYGYFDNYFSITISDFNYEQPSPISGTLSDFRTISISTGMDAAIGFGKNYKINEGTKCPILRCHQDRYSGWKINLRRFTRLTIANNQFPGDRTITSLFLNPNLSHEQKLFGSMVSMNWDFDSQINFSNSSFYENTSFELKYLNLELHGELRYYVGQKKRILQGQSGNNLSGLYLNIGSIFSIENYESLEVLNGEINLKQNNDRLLDFAIGFGYQKEFLRNMYIDLDLGIAKNVYENNFNPRRDDLRLISEIKVGFVFDNLFQPDAKF